MIRRRQFARAVPVLVLGMALCGWPAMGYYHYLHYASRSGPYTDIPEKFDLTALPNKTVTFYVTSYDSISYTGNDNLAAVLSQLRQAAAAWDSVGTSDLRVAFGGTTAGLSGGTPAAEIVFQDLPPGTLGLTTTAASGNAPITTVNGQFVPITRPIVALSRDLTKAPGPSYAEVFYTTAIHEMGHALGLQHTFVGGAMTQYTTRNTSRLRSIEADDIAGLSLLYPARGFAGNYGSLAGRVTSTSGQPVGMAAVTAIRASGSAVSALTAPDGTYRLDGLPPDQYYLYVQPLPPAADIRYPLDLSGQTISPTVLYFDTQFYPGTREPSQFGLITVGRGAFLQGINFTVQARSSMVLYDVIMYSYLGSTAISPAYANSANATGVLVAKGNFTGNLPRSVQALGSPLVSNMRSYGTPVNLALDLNFAQAPGTGLRHLLFFYQNDLFVLPSAFNVVAKAPPAITGVFAQADGTVVIVGANMSVESRVYFDGFPGTVTVPFTGSDAQGTLIVTPPPGASGHRATIVVYNPDGQNSLFQQIGAPPVYNYDAVVTPQFTISMSTLPAGSTAMVEITGINTRFSDGLTSVGFGTSDVSARRVWVLSPTRLVANVAVSPGAAVGLTAVSVTTGFQTTTLAGGFFVLPANLRLPSITLPLSNANPALTTLTAGSTAILTGSNLSTTTATITLNDQPVQVLAATPTQITFLIPSSIAPGMAILRLNNGTDSAYPVAIQID